MSFISFKRLALKVGIAIIILLILYLLTKLGISSIVPCTLTPPVIVSLRFGDHHQLLKLVLNPFQDFLAFDELTMSLHVHLQLELVFFSCLPTTNPRATLHEIREPPIKIKCIIQVIKYNLKMGMTCKNTNIIVVTASTISNNSLILAYSQAR